MDVPIDCGILLYVEQMSNDHSVRIFCSLALKFLPLTTIPIRNAIFPFCVLSAPGQKLVE